MFRYRSTQRHHLLAVAVAAAACVVPLTGLAEQRTRVSDAALQPQAVQAERTLTAARAAYPQYFALAYARYPQLPRGLLEAIAYSETGWVHVQPQPLQAGDHRHMPAAYGVMGLYHGQGFADQIAQGARLIGSTPQRVIADPQANIMAAAALLDDARRNQRARPLAAAVGAESWALTLAQYAGYGAGDGDVRSYARQSFAYGALQALQQGIDADGIHIRAQPLDMARAFDAPALARLRAPALRIDADKDSVETIAPADTGVAAAPRQTLDYSGAIWNPAYAGNYSTAGNADTAVILHTIEGSYAGGISWFKNPQAGVSAHYIVRRSDGQVTQMVSERHQAWHAKYHNYYTIGIEHDGYASDPGNWSSAMVNASAALTRSICQRRGVNCASAWQGPGYDTWHVVPDSVRIKGHGMLTQNSNRYDPGKYFPWSTYYSLINNGTPPPPPPPPPPGKYWVDTFATATGYKWPSTKTPVGTLYKGTNYVFCKAWGERVGSGSQYNHYWLKTDLDVGPAGAWVSAYYLSRWGNDEAKDNNGRVIPNC